MMRLASQPAGWFGGALLLVLFSGCAPRTVPESVAQAQAISRSPAMVEAEQLAPQTYLTAEKLRAESEFLWKDGEPEEAEAAADQAIAAYNHAFALARVARAEQRTELAQKEKFAADAEQARLDQLTAQVAADADAYEMRARVHLDQEPVKDVAALSPERAKMRRIAAKQLVSEGRLLCVSAELLKNRTKRLDETKRQLSILEKRLQVGSQDDDVFPKSAALRDDCLKLLTETRRPEIERNPEAAGSDRLLSDLSKTGSLMVYRDDRGVVVHLGGPLDESGALRGDVVSALALLAGAAKAHPTFPLLVVVHTARSGQESLSARLGSLVKEALLREGAPALTLHEAQNAQPVVSTSVAGADSKNERIEVVFVAPAR